MEKINGKLYNCEENYMVAKIGSTEQLNDKRIDKLIGGLDTLGLGPELIDTKIIFPKGISLAKWEGDWRRELALYTFSKEDMLELGLNDRLGPSEYILTYRDINTDVTIQKPKRELHLFKSTQQGKILWKTTKNNRHHRSKLVEPERSCSQCNELVPNSHLVRCHSCCQTLCNKCCLQCDCCDNFFCINSSCSTKCDICDILYCSNCVPKCEVCHEFCCSEHCSNILPCECGYICKDCDVKKPKYCQECQIPLCSKCSVRCSGCKALGCKDCIAKCSKCLERFCPNCGIESCYICGREVCKHNCSEMISECHSCGNECCHDCTSKYIKKTRSNKMERTCTECKS
ncbi:predicted protein [Naegleria gruberi]|uniref:Predicted protein n=1 Tax=Naegleria gruberi TaxID=5762 RepID=D2VXF9_NAEGR|nr:uncharacterized protein NAEGRDRAFT_73733 [Naegleria gruberi]EFC38432.1 predicted protein [Naegleria gruberi]|eukprot:XP_002671176.1 predicted protein [Naegleria gruberi strain NEG-M]